MKKFIWNSPKRFNASVAALVFVSVALITVVPGVTPAHAVAPIASSITPTDDATGVSVYTDITLNFDQNMFRNTGVIALKKTGDNSTVESWDIATATAITGFGTSTISIDRVVKLALNTSYYLSVPDSALKNVSNENYAGLTTISALNFTTSTTIDPVLVAGSTTSGYINATGGSARFSSPGGLTADANGNIYVADTGNNRIRKIAPDGGVTTLAGSGVSAITDGTGTSASFSSINRIAYSASTDSLFVNDSSLIREINIATGVVTSLRNQATIFSATRALTTVTLTFASPHGFAQGSSITVSGLGTELNGTFTVSTVPTATTLTYNTVASGMIMSFNPSAGAAIGSLGKSGDNTYWGATYNAFVVGPDGNIYLGRSNAGDSNSSSYLLRFSRTSGSIFRYELLFILAIAPCSLSFKDSTTLFANGCDVTYKLTTTDNWATYTPTLVQALNNEAIFYASDGYLYSDVAQYIVTNSVTGAIFGTRNVVFSSLGEINAEANGFLYAISGNIINKVNIGTSSSETPSGTWTSPSSSLTSRTLSYTLVFNKTITGLTSSDFSNTGTASGCVPVPSAMSGTTFTVAVVCTSDGTVILQLASNSVTDMALVNGPAVALNATAVNLGPVLPSATWTEPSSPSSSRSLNYSLTFNSSISGLTSGDFSTSGTASGCAVTPSSASGTTIAVGVVCSSDGTVTLQLAANAVSDIISTLGPLTQLNAASVVIDSVLPSATWTEPSTPSSSRTLNYTLGFNRSISGLASSDFSNTGTATDCVFTPSASSGTSITVAVVCASDGTVVPRLAANSVLGNGNIGPLAQLNATSVTIDSVRNITTTTIARGQITVVTIAPVLISGSTATTTPTPAAMTAAETAATPATTSTGSAAEPARTRATTSLPIPISTVAPREQSEKLAPIDISTVSPGGAALKVAGQEVPVKISRLDNQLLISARRFDATFAALRADGNILPLDSAGNIRLMRSEAVRVRVRVTGFAPNSVVEMRLYSDPILLGRPTVNEHGSLTAAYEIPDGLEYGHHRVVLAGKNYLGETIVFTAGIVIGAEATTSWMMWILIAISLLGVVLAVLMLPAIRRRRRARRMQSESREK